MLVPQNNNRATFDRGPCRISQERFAWLNERKYKTDLTRLEIADYVSYQFYHSFGYNLNIISPQTFNEKLQWLKVFYHNPIMHICADKAQIKNYIINKIPNIEKHCIEIYKIIYSQDDINFNCLPDSFIMKSNFGSGRQIFVNTSNFNEIFLREKALQWLNPLRNHYYLALEYSYKDIKPAVLLEHIITYEYKIEFFCFNGEPLCYWVILGDKTKDVCANYYTMSGEKLDVSHGYKNFSHALVPPPYFHELVAMAKTLSTGFPHVRVDFYAARDTWFFSEMTFYIWAGLKPFSSYEFDMMLGRHLVLEEK